MNHTTKNLPEDPEKLREICVKLIGEVDWLRRDVAHLEAKLRMSRYSAFAAKSEMMQHPGMQLLFPEEENKTEEEKPEKEIKVRGHIRKSTRKPLPECLPRKKVYLDLPENERTCSCCGADGELKEVSQKISEKLHWVPAQCEVIQYIRPVYSCKKCETMKVMPMPPHPIPGCSASVETIANIAVSKYMDSIPLYRQENILLRQKVELKRDKMVNWLIKIGLKLEPLVDLLHKEVLKGPICQIDETTVQVLKEKGRTPTSKSYMIVQTRGDPPGRAVVVFHYNPSRSKAVMLERIAGFEGVLLSDGLEVYGSLCAEKSEIVHAGCWSHARRKFVDAQKSRKPSKRKKSLAYDAVVLIDRLFKTERKAKDFEDEGRLMLRQEESMPVIDEIEKLIDKNIDIVPKSSPIGMALHYTSNQWLKLTRFLKDGKIPIHNNFTENMIRPFTVGRRNWLFCTSVEGAKASAVLYSLLVTAKVNGLNPYEYLCKTLRGISEPDSSENLSRLLPFSKEAVN